MTWRKWFVRSVMFFLVFALAVGYYVYQRWTNPEAVRQMALTVLTEQFPGAVVQLTSAELRFFGGIHLHDLRLTPRQGPSGEPFLVIPEAILYPDREKLASGVLHVQKIILRRPKFLLACNQDGTWNLEGLLGPFCATQGRQVPSLEVQDATFAFLDRRSGAPPLHLVEIHATLSPQENGDLRLQAQGQLSGVTNCRLQGSCNPCTRDAQLQLDVQGLLLGREPLQRIAAYIPDFHKHMEFELAGTAYLQAELAYHAAAERPFTYQLKGQVKRGRLQHGQLPFPLEDMEASFRYSGGEFILENCQGKAQNGTFVLMGSLSSQDCWQLKGEAKQLLLQPDLYSKLPDALRTVCNDFQPNGLVNVAGHLRQHESNRSLEYTVQPQRLTISFVKVPYPVHELAGTLQYTESLGPPRLLVHLNGKASGQPVGFRGQLYGEGLQPDNPATAGIDVTVTADNVPIDSNLQAALYPMPEVQKLLRQLRATGLIDCRIHILRPAGSRAVIKHEAKTHVICDAHDARFNYEAFPLPIEQARARVEFTPDGAWKFDKFEGWHQGGRITGQGVLRRMDQGELIDLDFEGERLPLDAALFAAVPPGIQKAWQHFRPEGRVNCVVRADFPRGRSAEVEVDVIPLGCSITPACFPYLLTNVQGQIKYAGDTVVVRNLSAMHRTGSIRLEQSKVKLHPNGRIYTELSNIHMRELIVDEELLSALPPILMSAVRALRPDRPLELMANIIVDLPSVKDRLRIGWNGYLTFSQCRINAGVPLEDVTGRLTLRGSHDGEKLVCQGEVLLEQFVLARQTFRQAAAQLVFNDDGLTIQELRAALHGGRVDGLLQLTWGDPLAYSIAFRAEQVELEEFARQTLGRRGQTRGKVNASMNLKGLGRDLRNLQGKASIKVEQGAKLYDLPLVFELLNYFGSRLPQGTLFQDASADLAIDGERIAIKQLELISEAITLRGQGDLKLDGTNLNLEMYGLPWGRRIPLLPPIIDRIPPTISKQLMKIRARGSLTQVKITPEPVPLMVEPFKEMLRSLTDQPAPK